MWTVGSADGKWRGRGLEDRGEWSGYVAFAAGPSGVLRWSPAGREVREKETYSIQTHVYERQDE